MGIQNAVADINESFEGSFPPADWQLYTTGSGWNISSTRSHSGSYSAYYDDYSGTQDGWLITPLLSVTNGDQISFWQNNDFYTYYTYHGLWVCTSDCGSPPTNWVQLAELGPAIEDNWEQKIFDLSAYAGQDIYLAFRYQGNWADKWYVDDVIFPYLTATAPTVTTQAVTDITSTTATGNGILVDLGSSNPTAHGVCWNTTGTPTTADSATDEGSAAATGAFTSAITGLSPNTTYYVRAYATNTAETSYGDQQEFKTLVALTMAVSPAACGTTTPTTGSTTNVDAEVAQAITASPGTGYHFVNWTSIPPEQAVFGNTASTSTTVTLTGSATITANFALDTYPVTYDANGADSGTPPADQTKTHGLDLTLAANTGGLARTGYTFAGWNTAADGSGDHYNEGATYTANVALALNAEWTGGSPAAIPTLSEWGIIALSLILAGSALWMIHRRQAA
jgi:hypothetical protein